jgi:hypothetical protein
VFLRIISLATVSKEFMTEPRDQEVVKAALSDTPEGALPTVEKTPRRKRVARGWPARLAVALFSLVLMIGVGGAALFASLARGPVEISFLSERLAAGLEERFGAGIDVKVGQTVLEKDAKGLSLHVLDVVLRDRNGRELLRSPDAVVGFNPVQLLGRKISPERLSLRGMSVKAEIGVDGSVSFRTADDAAAETAQGRDVAGLFLGFGSAGGSNLNAVSIENASLAISDRRNGKQLTFQNLDFNLLASADGMVQASGSVRKDADFVPFSIKSMADGVDRLISVAVDGIGNDVVQALIGAQAPAFSLALKIGVEARLRVDASGTLRDVRIQKTAASGGLTIPMLDPQPFFVERASLVTEWTAQKSEEVMVSADFRGGGNSMSLAGPMTFSGPDRAVARWAATGSGWMLSPLSAAERPVVADSAELLLVVDRVASSAFIERLTVSGPSSKITLDGRVFRDAGGVALKLNLDAGPMPLRSGLRWWPFFVSQSARRFLIDTVRSGDMTRLKIGLDMPGAVLDRAIRQLSLPREALALDIATDNASVVLAEGLPPIAGLSLQGKLDALGAQGAIGRAFIDMRQGRRIQLSDGAFSLNKLDTWTPDAAVRFKGTGTLDTLAEFLRTPIMRGAFGLDADPANVKGQFDGSVSIALPLSDRLKASDIKSTVEGRMTGVTVEKAIGKDRLDNATLTVSTDHTGIEIKGEGRWQGTPVTLSLEKDASDGSLATVLSLTLDDAALRRRGFNTGSRLAGSLPVKIRTQRNQGENLRAGIEVDLTRTTIDGLLPGFQKPAGRPGRLSFDAVERQGGYTIQNLAIDSGAASFRGQAETQADGSVTSARFSLFRLSPGDNVRLDFDRQGTGGKVVIRGNNFDARPFLRQASQAERSRTEADRELDLDLKTTLLSGHGGEVMTGADLRVLLRGGQLRQINLSGRLNGKPVSLAGRGNDGAVPVVVESDDAGALLRYLDLYSRMVGGDLKGQVNVSPRRIAGYFQTRDFLLRNEPAIRRLVSEGTTDTTRTANVETRFTKMRMEFNREGNEITIRDAVIFGPQLGLTFNGLVDNQRDRVSLSGTYIPAFGINNAFAQVPILGNILGGGRNEGLLAVTFGVSGRASQPNVTINPLSAITPGIFRKMFEFRNETTGNAQPQSPRSSTAN